MDWQEQLLRKDREENEHLGSQMRTLQNNIEALTKEKEKLEEDSRSLEKKLSQTKRWGNVFFLAKIRRDGEVFECLFVVIKSTALTRRCPMIQNRQFLMFCGVFALSLSTADLKNTQEWS